MCVALAAKRSTSLRVLQKDFDISALNKANQDLGLVYHSLYSSGLSLGRRACYITPTLLDWDFSEFTTLAMGHADDFTL